MLVKLLVGWINVDEKLIETEDLDDLIENSSTDDDEESTIETV
jgi:hypothetical protein